MSEPLEPAIVSATDVVADPSFVPPPPPIRRDDELPAVTGEIGFELTAPDVPQFTSSKAAPKVESPSTPRRMFRRQNRDTETVSTRTSGGTVVTFPPQNAPGSGEGEIGRITSSVPAVLSESPATPNSEAPINEALTGEALTDVALTDEVLSSEVRGPQADSFELDQQSSSGPPERAGFLVAPSPQSQADEPGIVADAEPWLLIDPEEVGGRGTVNSNTDTDGLPEADYEDIYEDSGSVDDSLPAAELSVEADDPTAAIPEEEDRDRRADLEYLFAVRTIDVGPVDLNATPDIAAAEPPPVHEAPQFLDAPELPGMPEVPEVQSASIVKEPTASATARPVVAEPEPELDFDATDDLDDLLAEFSAAMAPTRQTLEGPGLADVTVPSAEVIDHAADHDREVDQPPEPDLSLALDFEPPSPDQLISESTLRVDTSPEASSHLLSDWEFTSDAATAPLVELEETVAPEPPVDPASPSLSKLLLDAPPPILDAAPPVPDAQSSILDAQPSILDAAPVVTPLTPVLDAPPPIDEARTPSWIPTKTEAEVFASETSPLPARTRRGDHRSIASSPDAGYGLTAAGPPSANLAEDTALPKSETQPGQRLKRLLIMLHVLAVLGGALYIAINVL